VGGAPHEVPLFEHRDHPGHRRGLDLLVLGELARGHRLMPLQRRQGSELDVGERFRHAESKTLDPEPPGQPADGYPQRGRQPGVGSRNCHLKNLNQRQRKWSTARHSGPHQVHHAWPRATHRNNDGRSGFPPAAR